MSTYPVSAIRAGCLKVLKNELTRDSFHLHVLYYIIICFLKHVSSDAPHITVNTAGLPIRNQSADENQTSKLSGPVSISDPLALGIEEK